MSKERMIERVLRLRREDVVVLGGILLGEDHLGSIHGEPEGAGAQAPGIVIVRVVTTSSRAAELDALLADLAPRLALERD